MKSFFGSTLFLLMSAVVITFLSFIFAGLFSYTGAVICVSSLIYSVVNRRWRIALGFLLLMLLNYPGCFCFLNPAFLLILILMTVELFIVNSKLADWIKIISTSLFNILIIGLYVWFSFNKFSSGFLVLLDGIYLYASVLGNHMCISILVLIFEFYVLINIAMSKQWKAMTVKFFAFSIIVVFTVFSFKMPAVDWNTAFLKGLSFASGTEVETQVIQGWLLQNKETLADCPEGLVSEEIMPDELKKISHGRRIWVTYGDSENDIGVSFGGGLGGLISTSWRVYYYLPGAEHELCVYEEYCYTQQVRDGVYVQYQH